MAFGDFGFGTAFDPMANFAVNLANAGVSPNDVLRSQFAFNMTPAGSVNQPFTGGVQDRPVMPSVQPSVSLPGGPAGPATSGGDVFGLPSVAPATIAANLGVPANPGAASGGGGQALLDTLKQVKVQQPPVTPQPAAVRPPDAKDIKEQNMLAILNSLLLQRPQAAAPSLGSVLR